MNKIRYTNSQRIHNAFKTTLIQTIINPLLLFGTLCVITLVAYRSVCVEVLNRYMLAGTKEPNVSIATIDFGVMNNQFDLGLYINEDMERNGDGLQKSLLSHLNDTCEYLIRQQSCIEDSFSVVLKAKMNESEELTSQQSEIRNILKSLNSTIISKLIKDKEGIEDTKSLIDNAVFVGDKIDTSNLTLNYDDIQQALTDTINSQNSFRYDNSSLVGLNKRKDDFLSDLGTSFDDEVTKLREIDISSYSQNITYSFKIVPNLVSSNTSNSYGGSNSSNFKGITTSQVKQFQKDSKINLTTIGIFLFISYLLIMVYQYLRFRYQANYTISSMVDLEKREEKVDYLGILQRTNEPTVTMMMNVEKGILGDGCTKEKGFWINSYLFGDISNLPYLFFMCGLLLIVFLSLDKLSFQSSSSFSDQSQETTYSVNKSYNITQFADIPSINTTKQFQEVALQYNEELQSEFDSFKESLDDMFSQYNITSILGLQPPTLQIYNYTAPKFQLTTTSKLISELNELQFQVQTNVNVSNFQTSNIISTILHIISSVLIYTVKTALIVFSITFFFIIALGIIYFFFI